MGLFFFWSQISIEEEGMVCSDEKKTVGGRDGEKRKREVLPLLHDTPARPRTLSWQH